MRRDPAFRKGLLRDAVESLLAGEVALGKELLRDYINATVGFPKLAADTELHGCSGTSSLEGRSGTYFRTCARLMPR